MELLPKVPIPSVTYRFSTEDEESRVFVTLNPPPDDRAWLATGEVNVLTEPMDGMDGWTDLDPVQQIANIEVIDENTGVVSTVYRNVPIYSYVASFKAQETAKHEAEPVSEGRKRDESN